MIVDGKLPDADKAAGDSCNILPAIFGSNIKPSRPDMIVHSNDGVFAIRKDRWKWIEGVSVKAISPGIRKAHAGEFHEQLYNTQDAPSEANDVSAAHSEVALELRGLLTRYRDADYSRGS